VEASTLISSALSVLDQELKSGASKSVGDAPNAPGAGLLAALEDEV